MRTFPLFVWQCINFDPAMLVRSFILSLILSSGTSSVIARKNFRETSERDGRGIARYLSEGGVRANKLDVC